MGSLSIRLQLILIVLLGALPTAGIFIFSEMRHRAEDIQEARVQTQELTDSIAYGHQKLVAAAQQLASVLAQLPEVKNRDAARVRPILSKILTLNSPYLNLAIADRDGTVWASAVPTKSPFTVADRRFFLNAVATGKFSSGEYVLSRATNKPMLNFGYPFKNEQGRIIGVISIGFNLDGYQQLLENSKLPSGSSYALIDYKGVILSTGLDSARYVGKMDSAERMKEMLQGPDSATFVGRGLDGRKRIVSYRKLRVHSEQAPYMYVRAGIPLDVALAEPDQTLFTNVALFTSFLLCAFILALFIGKRSIADPVSLLKKASERLAAGDLRVRTAPCMAGGELASLAKSFDTMAEQLAMREKALLESEENYREIFDTTKDAIFVMGIETGSIKEMNKTAEDMFGYTRQEMLCLTVQELSSGESPYSLKEALQWMQTMLYEGSQSFEWLSKKKEGDCFWTEVLLSITRVGGERCALAVMRDISERSEINRVKDEMISAVNHEMRTPLTAMLGYLQFILENEVDQEQTRQYLGTVYKETERLKDLVNNFLDMQRLRDKHGFYCFEMLSMGELLEEAATLFACASDKHRITVSAAKDLPLVSGDEKSLRQVFNNLLSNAVKYSPDGGEIVLGARQEGHEIVLWVKDEGTGIPAEVLNKVFDRFYRVDNTARRTTNGTGLGLALVREIVCVHQGHVWAESVLGEGSTFFVSLPAAGNDPGTRANAAPFALSEAGS